MWNIPDNYNNILQAICGLSPDCFLQLSSDGGEHCKRKQYRRSTKDIVDIGACVIDKTCCLLYYLRGI